MSLTPRNDVEVLEHIFSRIVENHTGCWLWQGGRTSKGYGTIGWKKITWQVHRLVYTLHYGNIGEGLLIRHLCGNRICCNPLHLAEGTDQDNSRDRVVHGRCYQTKVFKENKELNPYAMFDENTVYDIRNMFKTGNFTYKEIGKIFNTSSTVISAVVRGKYYKNFNKVPPFFWEEVDEICFNNRITNYGAAKIKRLVDDGFTFSQVAKMLSVTYSQVVGTMKSKKRFKE